MPLPLLESHTEKHLLARAGSIITINADETADTALRTLVEHNILSAPVLNSEGVVVGLLDMSDFTEAILQLVPHRHADLRTALATSQLFHTVSARRVSEVVSETKLQIAPEDTRITELVSLLAMGKHRVVITTADGHVSNIVTQSALLAFLAQHIDALGDVAGKTVSELGLGQQAHIVSVHTTTSAAEAFDTLVKHKLSALPVLFPNGSLMGNLSVSDIKGVGKGYELAHLHLPVQKFIAHVKSEDIEIKSPTIVCKPSSPLRDVIVRMSAAKIHRIYVVDEQDRPVGVVSLTDIMKVVSAQ